MTFPLLGKSYFFACAAIAAQSREARCKNSRSAERGRSSFTRRFEQAANRRRRQPWRRQPSASAIALLHPPPNRRRMGGGSNLAPPPTGYRRAIARSAVQKQPERRARMFLCSLRRRTGGEWVEAATLSHHQQAIAAQSREARCKNSRSAERCARRRVSERNRAGGTWREIGFPLFARRRTGGEWVEVATLHHRQQAIATPRKVGT